MKTLLAFILFALSSLTYVNATDNKTIRISTKDTDLILQVGENGRLYQTYLGEKLLHEQDLQHFQWNIHAGSDGSVSKRGWEVYGGSGNEDFLNRPSVSRTTTVIHPPYYIMFLHPTRPLKVVRKQQFCYATTGIR